MSVAAAFLLQFLTVIKHALVAIPSCCLFFLIFCVLFKTKTTTALCTGLNAVISGTRVFSYSTRVLDCTSSRKLSK